ncbi:hypothetical protein B0H13DRAFT_1625765 [Mycena leptocephala]|nr:hypothetical protein B0H13DRAFT_1625765 [Mycena leptocephala]
MIQLVLSYKKLGHWYCTGWEICCPNRCHGWHATLTFKHPPNSPAISPIEQLWHVLKSCLSQPLHHPMTCDGLINTITEVWESILVEEVNKYVDWMPRVVQAVIDVEGGHPGF